MSNDRENVNPRIEQMFDKFNEKFKKAGLNEEVLSTMVKEFNRISATANHEQIHLLALLLEAMAYANSIQHMMIAGQEGLDNLGGEHDGIGHDF